MQTQSSTVNIEYEDVIQSSKRTWNSEEILIQISLRDLRYISQTKPKKVKTVDTWNYQKDMMPIKTRATIMTKLVQNCEESRKHIMLYED